LGNGNSIDFGFTSELETEVGSNLKGK